MKIWLVRVKNRKDYHKEYNYFVSAIIVANTKQDALAVHPNRLKKSHRDYHSTWGKPEDLEITEVGIANEAFKPGDIIMSKMFS